MKRIELTKAFGPVPDDCYRALMTAARGVKEETVVKRKLSLALVMILVLALAAGTALALVSWRDAARRIVEVEQQRGYYKDWPVDKKIDLARALIEQGYVENTEMLEKLLSGALTEEEGMRVVDKALVSFTGREVSEISFMEIMNAAWGPFEQWTKEEQAWYSQLMIDMGKQSADHTLYVMPEGPVDESQAVAIARREIAKGWGVDESALDAYTLTTTFQVPEFAEAGDTQAWWQVEYWTPDDMPEERQLFPISFWVFIHPETGALMEPVEVLRDQIVGSQSAFAAWENDPLRLELIEFDKTYNSRGCNGASLEGKAHWSAVIRPKMLAKQQQGLGMFTKPDLASTVFTYGLPDAQALSQEQALDIACQALLNPLGREEEDLRFFLHRYDVYYDITDADRPLWKFFFRMPNEYDSDEGFGREVKARYGEQRLPNYKVELDARTGELIAAFAIDLADVKTVEDFARLM